jgi:hypothetical protein
MPSTLYTRSRKRQLHVENLESRLNLSALTGLTALVHDSQNAHLSHVAQRSAASQAKPLTVSLGSAADAPVDTTSSFGDTWVNNTGTSSVSITDYSSISNARVEWRTSSPNIGYMTNSGVNLEYRLNVGSAGYYDLTFSTASINSWSSFDLAVNGSTAAQYGFSSTGSWDSYRNNTQKVYLNAGSNTLRISPTWGSQFNINAINLSPNGAAAAASSTTTASSTANSNWVGSSASITADKYSAIYNSQAEWNYNQADIGYVSTSGAYVEYTLNVQTAGNYVIAPNVASTSWATFDLLVNGSQAANYSFNSSGGWGNFQPQSNTVWLSAGTNTLRFASKWGTQYNIGTINISQSGASQTTTPATPSAPSAPATPVAPPPASASPVNISSAWMTSFNQLNVTGTSGNDNISVSQSGNTLYITANGTTTSYTASSYGNLVIKGGDGNDTISVDSSVNLDTLVYGGNGSNNLTNKTQGHGTIVAIGNGWDSLTGNGWNTSFWADSGDQVNAGASEWSGGHVHQVSSFWNGVSTQLNGQDLADPTGTGSTTRLTSSSLWGTGPAMTDVNQGQVADCFLMAPLQTMANSAADRLRETAVDLGDGTYAVQFKRNGTTTYVRVDGDLPAGGWYGNGLNYAHPSASGNQWVEIIEKAYAEFRTGAYNYNSLGYGNFNVVLNDLGMALTGVPGSDANSMFNAIQAGLWAGKGVTIGTNVNINSGAPLIGDHTYTVTNTWRDSSGTGYLTLRNPWGFDGAGNDGNAGDGLVTVSMYQLQSNMQAGSILV